MTFLEERSKEVKVGLLATIALIILYVEGEFLKGSRILSSSHVYHVTYPHSQGLSTSSPVLVNGKAIGRVRQIRVLPEQAYHILVTFEVQKDITITEGTVVLLVSPNLLGLGGKALDLKIAPGPALRSGSSLPGLVERGVSEVFTQKVLPALGDNNEPAVVMNQLMAVILKNAQQVDEVIANVHTMSQAVSQFVTHQQQHIETVVQQLASASKILTDDKNGIQPLLTKLNRTADSIEAREINQVVHRTNKILLQLEKALELSEGGQSLHVKIDQTVKHLDQLLEDIKENPKRYIHLSVFGK